MKSGFMVVFFCLMAFGACAVSPAWALLQDSGAGTNYLMGDVGVGSTSPGTKLDVNGSMRLVAATLGAACSPKGAQAYNTSTGAPMYCNASAVWASGVAASGFTSCTIRTGSLAPTSTVSCNAGETMTGGGCTMASSGYSQDYPSASATWYCKSSSTPSVTAYAICCS